MTATRRRLRKAFTMLEMLVAIIILAIFGSSMIRILVAQTRLFSKAAAQRSTRGVTRSAMNIIDSDLRMVEATHGIVTAGTTTLTVRAPYALGVVCATTGGLTYVSLAPVDSTVWATAGLSGYAWRDTLGVYNFTETTITAASVAPTICNGLGFTTLPNGKTISVSPALPSGAVAGTVVFFEEQIRYDFQNSVAVPGAVGLWRTVVKTGATDEIVTPFTSAAKFRYYVMNADTSQAAAPSPLSSTRGIEFTLAARSETSPEGTGTPATTSVTTAVFFRNRTN
jgi:prepilin-type N-terminal cleavage/methylation domain-containing protein